MARYVTVVFNFARANEAIGKGARKHNRDLQTYLRWKPGGRDDFFYTRIFFTPHIFFTISIFCLAAAENIDW